MLLKLPSSLDGLLQDILGHCGKLISAMTGGGQWLKDFADVNELIPLRQLPTALVEQLNPYVRERYAELWVSVRGPIREA